MAVLVFLAVAGPSAAGDKVIWRAGTLAPRGIGYARQISEILIPGVDEATEGTLSLKVYYGGILGDDEDYLRKIREGDLEATGTSAQGALMACPQMGVVALPFLFSGYDELDYVKPRMYPVFDRFINERGLKLLLWLDQGFDQFYSVKYPFTQPGDFARARFLTWMGPLEEALLAKLGAQAVPVDVPEFNDALRRDRADSYIGPPIWAVATQLYSLVKHVNATDVRYSPSVCAVSSRAWEALPDRYKANILAGRESWQDAFCKASRIENAQCLTAMRQYGLTVVTMNEEEKAGIMRRTRPLWDEMAGVLYPREVLDELLALLEEYRKSR